MGNRMIGSIVSKLRGLFELPVRILGPVGDRQFSNVEGARAYDFKLKRVNRCKGVSALVRVKNEAFHIEKCLRSIASVFDEIIVVDNGSTDETAAIVRSVAAEFNHIKLFHYPFALSRFGTEHNQTDEYSLHSMVYLYNWGLSHCSCAYVMKWDGDMYLDPRGREALLQYFSTLNRWWPRMAELEIQTAYYRDGLYYRSLGEINYEIMLFPNRADYYCRKERNFEHIHGRQYRVDRLLYTDTQVYELKNISEDEFDHWDTTDFPTERKQREYERYCLLKQGKGEHLFEVIDLADGCDLPRSLGRTECR